MFLICHFSPVYHHEKHWTGRNTAGIKVAGRNNNNLNFTSTQKIEMEKAMAPHASTLARKIPWTEEPGGLQSMGSLRVGLD